jgi:hypothetical protein
VEKKERKEARKENGEWFNAKIIHSLVEAFGVKVRGMV